MNINIRKAEKSDVPRIAELLSQVHAIHAELRPDIFRKGSRKYNESEIEEMENNPAHIILVGEHEGKVYGYIMCDIQSYTGDCYIEHKTLYIDDICVDEEAHGLHVGSGLYEHAVELARKNGCYNVTLNVWKGNTNALEFYKHCGMTEQKTVMEQIL